MMMWCKKMCIALRLNRRLKGLELIFYALSCAILLFGLVEGGWGTLQLLHLVESGHGRYPVTGSFYNPGPFGCFIGIIFPVALYLFIKSQSMFERALPLTIILLTALLLPGSMSRTGWAGAIVGSIVVVGGLFRDKAKGLSRKKLLSWALVCVAVALLLCLGAYLLKPDSAAGRLLMWKISAKTATLRPLLGVGWENVAGAYGNMQEAYFAAGLGTPREAMLADSPAYAFNEYLQIAIAFGIPAALLFTSALILAALLYWRAAEHGLAAVVIAMMVVCMSSYPLQFMEFKVLLVLIVFGSLWLLLRPLLKYGIIAVWVLFSVLLLTHTPQIDITEEFYRAQKAQNIGRYEASNDMFRQMLAKSADPMPLNLMGKNFQKLNEPDSAAHYYQRASHRVPNRIYPHYLLMMLYAEIGDTIKMRTQANIVLTKQPKTHSMAIEEMREEALKLLN